MPKKKDPPIVAYPVERAQRLVNIMGQKCATATALRELKRRQDAGENVSLWICGAAIFVGPPISE